MKGFVSCRCCSTVFELSLHRAVFFIVDEFFFVVRVGMQVSFLGLSEKSELMCVNRLISYPCCGRVLIANKNRRGKNINKDNKKLSALSDIVNLRPREKIYIW